MLTSNNKLDYLIKKMEYSQQEGELTIRFQWPKRMKSVLVYEYPANEKEKWNCETFTYKKIVRNEYVAAGGCIHLVPKLNGKIGLTFLPVIENESKDVVVLQDDKKNEIEVIARPITIYVNLRTLEPTIEEVFRSKRRIELEILPDIDEKAYIPEGTLELVYSEGIWSIQEQIGSQGLNRIIIEPARSKPEVRITKQQGRECLYLIQRKG